ncbi:MAG TPA: glycosyl hydrolase [Tepidisphaeraceae bacterium]|nr:glycosyl hydrolase [Tepidisphaeraceae bacterium]
MGQDDDTLRSARGTEHGLKIRARGAGRALCVLLVATFILPNHRQMAVADELLAGFGNPPQTARPWVFWYWMQAAVSRQGITADLEAMKRAGIGGAYLMSIKGPTDPPHIDPPVQQLTPQWWELVRHAMREADRLGLKLGMHACDGFATAGGPWITPELSMQKLVWSETHVAGGDRVEVVLPQPQTNEGCYRDVAILAYPSPPGAGVSTRTVKPKVTTSRPGVDAGFLLQPDSRQAFRSSRPCWIQYSFAEPFTCRSLTIRADAARGYQANRLRIEVSDDGEHFRSLTQLQPPRHGWQDGDAPWTHAIRPTTARHFRFVYDPAGSEPGAEDLDSAKWPPALELRGIELSSQPRIHQFEGKSGAAWRIARWTGSDLVPDSDCLPHDRIIDISERMTADGRLTWQPPTDQRWTILRIGHTSTGHRNSTGGAGRGLECDKFNPQAARLQFDRWFGRAIRQAGPELAGRVLKVFHVDSWECGSQNWSSVFRDEFHRRRGYDPLPWLPAMTGVPIDSADVSERFLYDVRQTIAELVVEGFYEPMAEQARRHGCQFSAECVAPTFCGDGMRHFAAVDLPMGEFWLRSPTHDKPNDILDAISAAHVYGKPLVQAEAFTQLRMAWDEHPAMLKPLGDRQYCLGINRLVYHVFVHNPWLDHRPGMTLDRVGLYFQRDQTWWEPAAGAFVQYAARCQYLLQQGRAVVDVAVFSGEELPRRAVLPEKLVATLPGIVGVDAVARESKRLSNQGQPVRELPTGVFHSANMTDPGDWIDALRGYKYDSINPDALVRLASVRDGRIELPGGASYSALVVPGSRLAAPAAGRMTPPVAAKLRELINGGARVILLQRPQHSPSLSDYPACDQVVRQTATELEVSDGAWQKDSFDSIGLPRDLIALDADSRRPASGIGWAHRAAPGLDIYFISNQQELTRTIEVSLRVAGRMPELWDPLSGQSQPAGQWRIESGRTILPLRLWPGGSVFVVLRQPTDRTNGQDGSNWIEPRELADVAGPWRVRFDPVRGGPKDAVMFENLESWTCRAEPGVRYYSGTATYDGQFSFANTGQMPARRIWLDLGKVSNVACVSVNGIDCGVAWTAPYRVEITHAIKAGTDQQQLHIAVTNTWANRMIGDRALPPHQRITRTTAGYRLDDAALQEAGLLGPVRILSD